VKIKKKASFAAGFFMAAASLDIFN